MKERTPAALSLDLDNLWAYQMIHGDDGWQDYGSYLDIAVPRLLEFLDERGTSITVFVVGKDATLDRNRDSLVQLGESRHELANHSHHHEPWIIEYSTARVRSELLAAHEAIEEATGRVAVGYRGPGFGVSAATVTSLSEMGYRYDASTLPTFIGPLARRYYFKQSNLSGEERHRRRNLFGRFTDGFRPLKPHLWPSEMALAEIPVTTMPFTRLPFHFSYLLYIAERSERLAMAYLKGTLSLCRLTGVSPSTLLHPLDFLGPEDVPQLGFFPGMNTPGAVKRDRLHSFLDAFDKPFRLGPIEWYLDQLGPLRPRNSMWAR